MLYAVVGTGCAWVDGLRTYSVPCAERLGAGERGRTHLRWGSWHGDSQLAAMHSRVSAATRLVNFRTARRVHWRGRIDGTEVGSGATSGRAVSSVQVRASSGRCLSSSGAVLRVSGYL